MKMLKRVGIFPVDQESITLFENIHECRYGEIMHIASIKAWGLCGKKIQRCDGSEIIIAEGIANIIKECEVLILLESWHDASPEYIKSVVKTAKQKSITIVSINNIRNSLEIDQHYENVVVAKKLKIQKKCDDLRVRKINIPVICVLGLTQNSGKLKMELELQKCLKQKGYKVAAIVSGLNGLIGKDTFCFEKKYLNGKNRNEEIIININAAVKRLEQDYDIVIVGIPGACLSFNPQYSNDFGITTQLFMCAIEPDYSVLMLPYMRYEEAFISHVKDEVQKRYDITINDIGISEFAIDMDASFEQKKMCFLKLIDKERDFEHLKKISVVDIKSDSQIEKLSDRIIWTLEN